MVEPRRPITAPTQRVGMYNVTVSCDIGNWASHDSPLLLLVVVVVLLVVVVVGSSDNKDDVPILAGATIEGQPQRIDLRAGRMYYFTYKLSILCCGKQTIDEKQ